MKYYFIKKTKKQISNISMVNEIEKSNYKFNIYKNSNINKRAKS